VGVFGRKETVAPEPITGTMALQQTLKLWLSRPGATPATIAASINEALVNAVDRSTVDNLARKLGASDAVVRGIAKSLMPGLSGTGPA
jgi:hypothetical protein